MGGQSQQSLGTTCRAVDFLSEPGGAGKGFQEGPVKAGLSRSPSVQDEGLEGQGLAGQGSHWGAGGGAGGWEAEGQHTGSMGGGQEARRAGLAFRKVPSSGRGPLTFVPSDSVNYGLLLT